MQLRQLPRVFLPPATGALRPAPLLSSHLQRCRQRCLRLEMRGFRRLQRDVTELNGTELTWFSL